MCAYRTKLVKRNPHMTGAESVLHSSAMFAAWVVENLKRLRLKQQVLADFLKLSHDKLSKSLNGTRRWQEGEERQIIKFFSERATTIPKEILDRGDDPRSDLGGVAVRLPSPLDMTKDVPVYGVAVGGKEGCFILNGERIDMASRPHALAGVREGFAIYVQGDSMSPRWEPGEIVYIHPGRPASPGCDVVVELVGDRDGTPGPCYLKRLVRQTAKEIICKQFNPPLEVRYSVTRVKRLYRVLSPTELFGI